LAVRSGGAPAGAYCRPRSPGSCALPWLPAVPIVGPFSTFAPQHRSRSTHLRSGVLPAVAGLVIVNRQGGFTALLCGWRHLRSPVLRLISLFSCQEPPLGISPSAAAPWISAMFGAYPEAAPWGCPQLAAISERRQLVSRSDRLTVTWTALRFGCTL